MQTCPVCHKVFKVKYSQVGVKVICCSRTCKNRVKNSFTCRICNINFTGLGPINYYCSKACKNASRLTLRGFDVSCQVCRKIFRAANKNNLNRFCSRQCSGIAVSLDFHNNYALLVFLHHGLRCNRCDLREYLKLTVHHRDHNKRNNRIENLEVLCYNCHSFHHWGASENKKVILRQIEYIRSKKCL